MFEFMIFISVVLLCIAVGSLTNKLTDQTGEGASLQMNHILWILPSWFGLTTTLVTTVASTVAGAIITTYGLYKKYQHISFI